MSLISEIIRTRAERETAEMEARVKAALSAVRRYIEDRLEPLGPDKKTIDLDLETVAEDHAHNNEVSVIVVKSRNKELREPLFRVVVYPSDIDTGKYGTKVSVRATCKICHIAYWHPKAWEWPEMQITTGLCPDCRKDLGIKGGEI